MKTKYKKLVKNTSIFALGTLGSKIIVFLVVPLYTYVLSTAEYGKIDILTSTISLLIPFTTLLIYEASIRFLIAKEANEKTISSNCLVIFIAGSIFSLLLSPCLLYILNLQHYLIYFLILLVATNYTTIFGQLLRAKGDNWGFSISGIIITICTVLFNILFLLLFKKGIDSYLTSLIIAQLLAGFFIFIRCKGLHSFSIKNANYNILKKMLIYSIPLVPNNIMWWIMNAGDKYVINYYLGDSANGIFSISYKIPTLITMIFSIFMQAWQVSAIEEMNTRARNNFYKNVFNYVSLLLFFVTSCLIFFTKPIFDTIIKNDFSDAWKYVPYLCIATLFNCLATFAGVVYITEKASTKSFLTTFIGAICNLLFNFLLIQSYGLFGVSIGTIAGYLLVMILRFKDFKKYYKVRLLDTKIIFLFALLIADSSVYVFLDNNIKYIAAIFSIAIVAIIAAFTLKNQLSPFSAKKYKDNNQQEEK